MTTTTAFADLNQLLENYYNEVESSVDVLFDYLKRAACKEEMKALQQDKEATEMLFFVFLKGGDNEELLNHLLLAGMEVNIKNRFNTTPLMHASQFNYTGATKLLLNHGADANATNVFGYNPIMCATMNGSTGTARLLLEHGVDANVKTKNGESCLHLAVANGQEPMAALLCEYGAVVDDGDKKGSTPLMQAAIAGDEVMVQTLLNHHADTSLKNKDGKTASTLAKNESIKELLRTFAVSNYTMK